MSDHLFYTNHFHWYFEHNLVMCAINHPKGLEGKVAVYFLGLVSLP